MGISLVVPTFGSLKSLQRTLDSAKPCCDELLVTSTCPYPEDVEAICEMADTVVELPWNYSFINGLGPTYQIGAPQAKNDWCILLGNAETIADGHQDIVAELNSSPPNVIHRCWHHNDPHTWTRVWNPREGGTYWHGLIHEEITNGHQGKTIFRMQDTDKDTLSDQLKAEVLRYMKALLYNHLYKRLHDDHSLLGAANEGWIKFVQGSITTINEHMTVNADLLEAVLEGDFEKFKHRVMDRLDKDIWAPQLGLENGVTYKKTGDTDEKDVPYVGHPDRED
jgi:hypothetical protein